MWHLSSYTHFYFCIFTAKILAGPGSGKGLLSERLVKECGVIHLSSGDLLREEVEANTPLGKQVDEIMKSGGLVSSAIIVALMQKRMKDQ